MYRVQLYAWNISTYTRTRLLKYGNIYATFKTKEYKSMKNIEKHYKLD